MTDNYRPFELVPWKRHPDVPDSYRFITNIPLKASERIKHYKDQGAIIKSPAFDRDGEILSSDCAIYIPRS